MKKMTPFNVLISRKDALNIIYKSIKPIDRIEKTPIEESLYRVIAKNIYANMDVPPFNRAAMDGYALKAEDTYDASLQKPVLLKVISTLHAGESESKLINWGECVQISTGCPIPPGTNAVVMVEFTKVSACNVEIFKAVYPGANISLKGEDIKKDEVILKEKEHLTEAKIGVLAALGRKLVSVYEKPSVAVIPTGSEICELDTELRSGQIYDVNSYTLSVLLRNNGAKVTRSKIIPDSLTHLKSAVRNYLNHDLIIFSGGSSVGERDLIVSIIKETGKVLFHGVQIKPGKPTLFGLIKGVPVFGMPGYPTSCLSNAFLFLIPTIRKMANLPRKKVMSVKAKMGARIVSTSGREHFVPVKLKDGKAFPVYKKSGDITSLAEADGYLVLPINQDVLEQEEDVTITLF
jgi:molybdenum cofactor synthesis domain-containing protein